MAGVAERPEGAVGFGHSALDLRDLVIRESDIIVVPGAVLDNGAGGRGLDIFRQFAQHPDGIIYQPAHGDQCTTPILVRQRWKPEGRRSESGSVRSTRARQYDKSVREGTTARLLDLIVPH